MRTMRTMASLGAAAMGFLIVLPACTPSQNDINNEVTKNYQTQFCGLLNTVTILSQFIDTMRQQQYLAGYDIANTAVLCNSSSQNTAAQWGVCASCQAGAPGQNPQTANVNGTQSLNTSLNVNGTLYSVGVSGGGKMAWSSTAGTTFQNVTWAAINPSTGAAPAFSFYNSIGTSTLNNNISMSGSLQVSANNADVGGAVAVNYSKSCELGIKASFAKTQSQPACVAPSSSTTVSSTQTESSTSTASLSSTASTSTGSTESSATTIYLGSTSFDTSGSSSGSTSTSTTSPITTVSSVSTESPTSSVTIGSPTSTVWIGPPTSTAGPISSTSSTATMWPVIGVSSSATEEW
jgi:hypothetical protein